jgi:hypothetical protein
VPNFPQGCAPGKEAQGSADVRRILRCLTATRLLAEIVRTWDQKFPAADTVGRVDPEITELLAALNPLVRHARALTGAGG